MTDPLTKDQKCLCGTTDRYGDYIANCGIHEEQPTSNKRLPDDHLCPKCGEYVMCGNVDEIERLTREVEESEDEARQANLRLDDMTRKWMAECDRLRAALERIVAYEAEWAAHVAYEGDQMRKIASEALRGADEPGESNGTR